MSSPRYTLKHSRCHRTVSSPRYTLKHSHCQRTVSSPRYTLKHSHCHRTVSSPRYTLKHSHCHRTVSSPRYTLKHSHCQRTVSSPRYTLKHSHCHRTVKFYSGLLFSSRSDGEMTLRVVLLALTHRPCGLPLYQGRATSQPPPLSHGPGPREMTLNRVRLSLYVHEA